MSYDHLLWQKIWNKKSIIQESSNNPLHAMCGFDSLSREQWKDLVHFFVSFLIEKNNPCVLDVGCGVGAFSNSLKEFYPESTLFGFDICDKFVSIAQKNVDGKFCVLNALEDNWEFEKNYFDLILSFSVFQYFDSLENAELVLNKMSRLLNQNGSIFIGDVPNLEMKELDIFERANRDKLSNLSIPNIYPSHQYYPKSFFCNFADNLYDVSIIEHRDSPFASYFPNSMNRYSVILKRTGNYCEKY